MPGPLEGIRIVEFAGIGPGPFCGMMLADHGAEVIRIERGGMRIPPVDPLARGRKSIVINIKQPEGAELARKLVDTADGLIEGNRPGVMERLGLGPDDLLKRNPGLVYGRMTGWGQTGPYAQAPGHDINYIALSGVLHSCGRAGEKPTPPVNYLGDFGGGAMMLAFGMVSALLAVKNGAQGQVIDCAMTDGSALLASLTWGFKASGMWQDMPGQNIIDTGSHYYDVYETKDGKWISIGAIETQFYANLRDALGLDDPAFDAQQDPDSWPELKEQLTAIFKTRTRDEWCALLEDAEICFAPVLSLSEAPDHPHNQARQTFTEVDGHKLPAPAPRYSVSKTRAPSAAPAIGAHTDEILSDLGLSASQRDDLRASKAIN
ncbi:CaiB/BaiF CoA-transferase family protein [Parvularcula sp. IMCC14364]|uniref:CaiB/BaiF CoA transferase family protein n=1 Tax=Parvularcula sp. IMCC14364 TaxID=3067902 RepID=UPI002741CAF3|nr:CaiB/BaiF CoA-transferase family protein [Parvularcula sp. IMCC14364]